MNQQIEISIRRYKRDLIESLDVNYLRDLGNIFGTKLSSDEAKQYLYQGVLRRLMLIKRCIENINHLCPIDAKENIHKEDNADLVINLHAFYINSQGLLDNIAWIFVHEKNIGIDKLKVGLFKKEIEPQLPRALSKYLSNVKDWYFNYSKLYRDCLAHRIPIYAPSLIIKNSQKYKKLELEKKAVANDLEKLIMIMEDQEKLLEPPKVIFTSELEKLKGVKLHAQTLVDFITVKEIIKIAFK